MSGLTEADRDCVRTFLKDQGHGSIEEWARDSDYYEVAESSEWYSLDDLGPFASPVDLEVACFQAYVAAGEAQDEQRYSP